MGAPAKQIVKLSLRLHRTLGQHRPCNEMCLQPLSLPSSVQEQPGLVGQSGRDRSGRAVVNPGTAGQRTGGQWDIRNCCETAAAATRIVRLAGPSLRHTVQTVIIPTLSLPQH